MAELQILPGVEDACQDLRRAGYVLSVVTNQPDIARGLVDPTEVKQMNDLVQRSLSLDDVLVCPHDDDDKCSCRKPLPGLLESGAARWNLDLPKNMLVGDRWRDVEAGQRAGCRTVFVDHGYAEPSMVEPDLTVRGLSAAVPWILDRLEDD
jgi:D-glycero-D-manno-heptose 1,7-bisphosphate phosphatase